MFKRNLSRVVLAGLLGFSVMAEAGVKKSLVIAIDGLRGDGIPNCDTPHIDRLMKKGLGKGYRCAYTFVAHTIKDAAPSSGANHTSIMTGVTAKKHKVTTNGNVGKGDHKTWPHYLKRLEGMNADLNTVYLVSWGTDLEVPSGADMIFQAKDNVITPRAVGVLNGSYSDANWKKGRDVDALFFFLDDVDHAGHSHGFDVRQDHYQKEVKDIDRQVGLLVKAIKGRKDFKNEDWEIVLTSDHGGRNTSHGIFAADNYTIPFIVVSKGVKAGEIKGDAGNKDAAVTALKHMGYQLPGNLDGEARGEEIRSARRGKLSDGLSLAMSFDGDLKSTVGEVSARAEGIKERELFVRSGKFGECLDFDGRGGAVNLGKPAGLDFGKGAFSVAFWFNANAKQDGDAVILGNKDWSSGGNNGLVISSNEAEGNAFGLNISDDNSNRVDADWVKHKPGEWMFVCVTLDRDGMGVLYMGDPQGHLHFIANDIRSVGEVYSQLDWYLGSDGTGKYDKKLKGKVDELAAWKRELRYDEVKELYNKGKGRSVKQLGK